MVSYVQHAKKDIFWNKQGKHFSKVKMHIGISFVFWHNPMAQIETIKMFFIMNKNAVNER